MFIVMRDQLHIERRILSFRLLSAFDLLLVLRYLKYEIASPVIYGMLKEVRNSEMRDIRWSLFLNSLGLTS